LKLHEVKFARLTRGGEDEYAAMVRPHGTSAVPIECSVPELMSRLQSTWSSGNLRDHRALRQPMAAELDESRRERTPWRPTSSDVFAQDPSACETVCAREQADPQRTGLQDGSTAERWLAHGERSVEISTPAPQTRRAKAISGRGVEVQAACRARGAGLETDRSDRCCRVITGPAR
jgi:hypothetical protein